MGAGKNKEKAMAKEGDRVCGGETKCVRQQGVYMRRERLWKGAVLVARQLNGGERSGTKESGRTMQWLGEAATTRSIEMVEASQFQTRVAAKQNDGYYERRIAPLTPSLWRRQDYPASQLSRVVRHRSKYDCDVLSSVRQSLVPVCPLSLSCFFGCGCLAQCTRAIASRSLRVPSSLGFVTAAPKEASAGPEHCTIPWCAI